MKIAITSTDDHLFGPISPDFQSARFFIILNPRRPDEMRTILNPHCDKEESYGKACVELLRNHQVDAVITGNCHPQTLQLMKNAGMKVYPHVSGTVFTALSRLKDYYMIPE